MRKLGVVSERVGPRSEGIVSAFVFGRQEGNVH